jgi:hypothetical protein
LATAIACSLAKLRWDDATLLTWSLGSILLGTVLFVAGARQGRTPAINAFATFADTLVGVFVLTMLPTSIELLQRFVTRHDFESLLAFSGVSGFTVFMWVVMSGCIRSVVEQNLAEQRAPTTSAHTGTVRGGRS